MGDRGGVERAERVDSGDGEVPLRDISEGHEGGGWCEEGVCPEGCGGREC